MSAASRAFFDPFLDRSAQKSSTGFVCLRSLPDNLGGTAPTYRHRACQRCNVPWREKRQEKKKKYGHSFGLKGGLMGVSRTFTRALYALSVLLWTRSAWLALAMRRCISSVTSLQLHAAPCLSSSIGGEPGLTTTLAWSAALSRQTRSRRESSGSSHLGKRGRRALGRVGCGRMKAPSPPTRSSEKCEDCLSATADKSHDTGWGVEKDRDAGPTVAVEVAS